MEEQDQLEWLHCNRCKTSNHRLYGAEDGLVFYMTSCAHAICQICMQKSNSNLSLNELVCPKCQNCGPIVILSDNEIPADVERLVTPIQMHLEDLLKIFQYQNGNSRELINHLKKSNIYNRRRSIELEEELKKTQQELTELRRKLMNLEKSNQSMKFKTVNELPRTDLPRTDMPRPQSAASNRSFSTVKSNPKFSQRLSMNSPFDDQRPKTGKSTFQRPETSAGIPLRSTMSSYAYYTKAGQENRFNERPATGAGISKGLYSRLDKDDFRSEKLKGSSNDTPVSGYKGTFKIIKKGKGFTQSYHPANRYSKK